MPSSRRYPSVVSISSNEDDATTVIEISSTSSRHSSLPTTSLATPTPDAPYNLVTGNMISWTCTDGVNTVPNLHNNHATNYFEKVEPDDNAHQKYLEQIGTYIARAVFGYTDTPYFMAGLPGGYSLWRHHSQPKSTQKPREDVYLYGPKRIKKFRSPNEFTMHAVWLMGGGPSNPASCECKHCGTLDSQIQINKRFGLPGQHDIQDHHHHS
ncbi:unnamed protein product [Rhizoctonia solani]|uniref:Cryptic loci regulator 2 N-terminal domain-containing protein n=1 Tax=Rhizoctonia solani TaxID=456999 RepID=A0A8H3E7D5_9AGAM|nr:unnamed protein product [Rhizoctonia solani]